MKRIYTCMWCGIRPGAVQSAFCNKDAKRLGIKLVDYKRRLHYFMLSTIYKQLVFDSIADAIQKYNHEKTKKK